MFFYIGVADHLTTFGGISGYSGLYSIKYLNLSFVQFVAFI